MNDLIFLSSVFKINFSIDKNLFSQRLQTKKILIYYIVIHEPIENNYRLLLVRMWFVNIYCVKKLRKNEKYKTILNILQI